MAFKGDLRKMGELEESLRRLAEVPSRASPDAAERIDALIQQQFDDGTDPYGAPWAPLATSTILKGRYPPPLTDSGSLRSGIEVKPQRGAGISITIDDGEIAGYHQTGTKKMPARPILPDHGLPETWEDAIKESTAEAFATNMKNVPGRKR